MNFSAVSAEFLLSTSVMMSIVGMMTAIILARVNVRSWRLQSVLAAAVLLQGIMFFRTPVHLGLLEPEATTIVQTYDHATDAEFTTLPINHSEVLTDRLSPSELATASATPASEWAMFRDIRWEAVLWSVWLIGIVVLMVLAIAGYARMIHRVARLQVAPEAWQRQWRKIARRPKPPTMLVSQSMGPLMLRRRGGYALIVPETYWDCLNDQQRHGVMLHELAHLDRHDIWRQLFARLIATIHWFNPVAWWAVRQYEEAAELACDQRVRAQGRRVSAGFASALVDLVQWHQDTCTEINSHHGIGLQAMAAPPLTSRVNRLLQPNFTGDSLMKRIVLAALAIAIVAMSFVQVRLTAQESTGTPSSGALSVIDEAVDGELQKLVAQLDSSDDSTARFASLANSTSGKLAISGYLSALSGRALEDARSDAVARFMSHYFTKGDNGKYVLQTDKQPMIDRWEKKSQRLTEAFERVGDAMTEIATNLDDDNDAGALMKRLLQDPQAPAAILLFEMKGGGDAISRHISEALDEFLVDRGDGTFQIVESKRAEGEEKIRQLEIACKIHEKLARHFPQWALELDSSDERNKKFADYLKRPATAGVVSMILIKDNRRDPTSAVDDLFNSLEEASIDTPKGLQVSGDEVWSKLHAVMDQVERAEKLIPKVQERLADIADSLSTKDPLAVRLATQMRSMPLAALMSAELPYADLDAGQQLRDLFSKVTTKSDDGKLSIHTDREEEITAKARELLRVCRSIRRYIGNVDDTFGQLEDQEFVSRIGDAGRYMMLSEVRRFAESHRPDPIALLRTELLTTTNANKLRVRDDQREIVRRLIDQAEKVRGEEANDDF